MALTGLYLVETIDHLIEAYAANTFKDCIASGPKTEPTRRIMAICKTA